MNPAYDLLIDFKNEIGLNKQDFEQLQKVWGKASLYSDKFFPDKRYAAKLKAIGTDPVDHSELEAAFVKLSALVDTMIEDSRISNRFKVIDKEELERLHTRIDDLDSIVITLQREKDVLYNEHNLLQSRYLSLSQSDMANKGKEVLLTNDVLALKQTNAELENYKLQASASMHELTLEREVLQKHNAELLANLTKTQTEISTLKEIKQKTEIAKNSVNFQKQASVNKSNSRWWMLAIVTTIAMFITYVFIGFKSNDELYNIAAGILSKAKGLEPTVVTNLIYVEVAKKIASKALLYSMSIYFITFLVKNYNADMHNYVVNAHKANALSSTVDLIGTAKQDDGNDKILVQATQAIFTTQRSGYQGPESEPSNPNLVTNVIEAVSGKVNK